MKATSLHYDQHLGPRYAWMTGEFEVLLTRARSELAAAGLKIELPGRVLDLGAGRGQHTVVLARAGWRVTAFEACAPLRAELLERTSGLPVETDRSDWVEWIDHHRRDEPCDAILCLGDTLCHLSDKSHVQRFLTAAVTNLAPRGRLILSLRDYSDPATTGTLRFVPVKSDPNRILTCALHFGQTHVVVHDLFHERQLDDTWTLSESSYFKIRLWPADIAERLVVLGCVVTPFATCNGMVGLVASRAE